MTRIRTRIRRDAVFIGQYHDWITPGSPPTSPFVARLEDGVESVFDENHGVKWTQGGEMWLDRYLVTRTPSEEATIFRPNHSGPNDGIAYQGRLTARQPTYGDLPDGQTLAYDYGADLYNMAKPDRPIFRGLNAFYELKDIPGALKQRFQLLRASGWGNLYLAYQFGWAPLMQDVRDFVVSHFALKRALDQFIRDEGKAVRRQARLKTVSYGPSPSGYNQYAGFEQSFVTPIYRSVPFVLETHQSIYDVWFSGRFKYYLPPGPRDWLWDARMTARIFGFNPTPAAIYRMIPWTWLVDWFSNVGNVLENMDTTVVDRLANDYAYVMCHTQDVNKIDVVGRFLSSNNWDGPAPSLRASTSLVREQKRRFGCDPFSFRYQGESLSGEQAAILGALGLVKASRPHFG